MQSARFCAANTLMRWRTTSGFTTRRCNVQSDRQRCGDVLRGLEANMRVEHVVEAVPEEIDREHAQHDRKAREEGHPPCVREKLAAVGKHVAPLGRWRLDSKPEEAKRRPDDNGARRP